MVFRPVDDPRERDTLHLLGVLAPAPGPGRLETALPDSEAVPAAQNRIEPASAEAFGAKNPNGRPRVFRHGQFAVAPSDPKELITDADTVFQHLASLAEDEPMGKVYNSNHHPVMPAGVFQLMLEALKGGRPFAGYVSTLAKDGSLQWAFATVMPVEDGYLTVRTAPRAQAPWEAAMEVYRQVVAVEKSGPTKTGADRARAAEAGRRALDAALAELGFASYEGFMLAALSAEMLARAASAPSQTQAGADGPVGRVLAGASGLKGELDTVVDRLTALQKRSEKLVSASGGVAETVARLTESTDLAVAAAIEATGRAGVLASCAGAMAAIGATAAATVRPLAPSLAAVGANFSELSFRIGLARLHADIVSSFAGEVAEGLAPASGLANVSLVCSALAADALRLSERLHLARLEVGAVAEAASSCVGLFGQIQKLLTAWRFEVPQAGLPERFGSLAHPISEQLACGLGQLADLRDLARDCSRDAARSAPEALLEPIWRVAAAAAEL